jgi:hypothetical protein
MAVKRKRPEQVISREVIALRRTVWLRRLVALAALTALGFAWQAYLDARFADRRAPAVALAEGSQVYADAWHWLSSAHGQLALQVSYHEFGRLGRPGEYNPAALTTTKGANITTVRLSNYGSLSESGAPIILPQAMTIERHVLGRAGDVRFIWLTCTYHYCWDRQASAGRILADGEPLPQTGTSQHSRAFSVTDHLTLSLSNRTGTWVPQLVRRETRTDVLP